MSAEDRAPGSRRAFRLPGATRRVDADIDEEMRFHIDERVDELVARGMSRDEAEREVRARFGDVEAWRRATRSIDTRRIRRENWLDIVGVLARDLRYAVRGMVARPGLTAAILLTLALAIGATTAIYSTVHSVLLRPLPVDQLERMLVVRGDYPGLELRSTDLSPAHAEDLFTRRDLFAASTAYRGTTVTLTGTGEPRRLRAARTMGEFFPMFDGQPLLGTVYRPEDSETGRHQVVVLSHDLWQEIAGGDRAIVGRYLELDDKRYQVIGVMPPGFGHPRSARLWLPQELSVAWRSPQRRSSLVMTMVGRLAPGVSPDDARAALAQEAQAWHERFVGAGYDPATHFGLMAVPLVEYLAGELRVVLLALMGAVMLVLLIACANVASLQLVRAIGRAKEIAVRGALGAGRGAIARQLLVESLVLALVGGALGVTVAALALRALRYWAVGSFELLQYVTINGPALAVTAVVALGAGLLFGVVPAIRARRMDLNDVLRDSSRGSSGGVRQSRLLQGTVVVQVALTLVLLLAAGTLTRSLGALLAVDPGFRPDALVTAGIAAQGERYSTPDARIAFFEQVLARVRALPGVQSAAVGSGVPFTGTGDSSPFKIESIPVGENEPARHANLLIVSPRYFETVGIPLLRGREFTPADRDGVPIVAIIDEMLARRYFGDVDPIGRQISQGSPATIVGVVGAATLGNLDEPEKASIYYPTAQYYWASSHQLVVRSTLPSSALIPALQRAVAEVDPNVPLYEPRPVRELLNRSVVAQRLSMGVATAFAVLSLLLAALGVYGVISYGVRQREQEIGIRMALGATPRTVMGLIVRGGAGPVVIGMAAGLGVYLAAGRLVERSGGAAADALLFGVGVRDPQTIAVGTATVIAIALVACVVPARRAGRVSPTEAMRAA